jgi:diguanylate cyclase (GGDEF)-like protein
VTRVLAFGLQAEPLSWLPKPVSSFGPQQGVQAAVDDLATGGVSLLILDHASAPRLVEELLTRSRELLGEAMPPVICCLDPHTESAVARTLVAQHEVRRLVFHPLERAELSEEVGKLLGRRISETSAAEAARATASLSARGSVATEAMLDRIRALDEAFAAYSAGCLTMEQRRAAEQAARKIVGSAATYGAPDAASIASNLMRMLRRALPDSSPADLPEARDLLHRLRQELDYGSGSLDATSDSPGRTRLLIVDADAEYVDRMVEAARIAGYDPVGVTQLDAAREQMLRHRPGLVLLDVALDAGEATGYSLLRAFSVLNPPVPVVALTDSAVLMDRVHAARMGARVFLQRSTSPDRIFAEVASLLQRLQPMRPRIMAVDADSGVRHSLHELLRPAGLDIVSTSDPLDFWSLLESTSPDLIILDVDLPTVSGIELCRVVRDDPRWSSMPVVFLTGNSDAETVQRIFTAGADDFVSKPIVGPELVTRVRNRLERSQLLRSLSESDPLTGISNRRRALELVERLLALARRHAQPLCIALLDLDAFKRVNDEHGHAAGDRVLRRLAEMLQRKFRGEDVVGRWGGEEFVLGMYGMTGSDGERRLYEVLSSFRAQEFGEDGRSLTVTFSAGIAEHPRDGDDFEMLYRAADEALYAAKRAGRSRIVRARADPSAG